MAEPVDPYSTEVVLQVDPVVVRQLKMAIPAPEGLAHLGKDSAAETVREVVPTQERVEEEAVPAQQELMPVELQQPDLAE